MSGQRILFILFLTAAVFVLGMPCGPQAVHSAEAVGGNTAWRPATPSEQSAEVPAVRPEGLLPAPAASSSASTAAGTGGGSSAGASVPSTAHGGAVPGSGRGENAGRVVARVTPGNGTLPSEHGQIWRDYDISPYTNRITTVQRPQQTIIDWILRETGYETWHGEAVTVLSADRNVLRVYHTPEVHTLVAQVVERFIASQAEPLAFSLRVASVDHPNWRAKVHRVLRPIPVQTAGANAWLMEKEDAALLLADLQRRSDYREHGSPHLLVNSGQSAALTISRTTPYTRDVLWRQDLAGGFETVVSRAEDGFVVELTALPSVDRKLIDAIIRCEASQVERLVPVVLDVPTPAAPRQRMKIEVPQVVHFRFHERFRWPADKVLLLSMGVVPSPDGKGTGGIALPFGVTPGRSDLLVMVECKGQPRQPSGSPASAARHTRGYQGQY